VAGHDRSTNAPESWHVSWGGAASKGQHLEIPAALAGCLGIAQGITVSVRVVTDIPEAIGVCVEPLSIDDWEVVEQNAGHMEEQILSQVSYTCRAMAHCTVDDTCRGNALQLLNLTPGRKRNSVCTCLSACCFDLQLYTSVHSAGRGCPSWASFPFLGTSADKAAAESHNSPPSITCATSERL